MSGGYEMVIGLEVHVELNTAAKIFCRCPTAFGAPPNTQCCPVCMGMPGALPVLNREVVRYAAKAGLATHCQVAAYSKHDRKNYFYPDLPKAYQITQYDLPLCSGGYLDIELSEDGAKRIGITRIHIEEDAGKLVHAGGGGTLIDFNRCGVPLIEIVSGPDIRSAREARAYLEKLRAILLYTGISDCRMNEGSLRCDVNLSVREKGAEAFGTRTEMKNLNSFQYIAKAIEYEYARQVGEMERGGAIAQETRRFDPASGKTYPMRRKEDAGDYRCFPDPDLPPIEVSPAQLARWLAEIPVLPDQRKQEYMGRYGLGAYSAEQLTTAKGVADYFEVAAPATEYPKLLANLMLTEVFRLIGAEREGHIPISPAHMAALADLLGGGRLNSSTCKGLLQEMWEGGGDPETLVRERGLEQVSGMDVLLPLAREVLAECPAAAADYRSGKAPALQSLTGQVMKKTRGKGNPVMIQEILTDLLGRS